MTPFNRQAFDTARVRRVMSRARSLPPYLSPIVAGLDTSSTKLKFNVNHLVYLLDLIVGGAAAEVLMRTNGLATLRCADAIIDNYLRISPSDQVQDLQLTLGTNAIVYLIKSTPLPMAAVSGAADLLLKECNFSSDFKLEIRQQLFDNKLIDQPFLRIIYY